MQRKLPRRKDVAQNNSPMNYFFDNFADQKFDRVEQAMTQSANPLF